MPKTNYYYFTEQPYTGYDPALQEQYPALRLNLPNTNYDPQIASDLYNRYHDEYQVADDVGFDGIMINEHHTAPFCMQASINITGTVLPTRQCFDYGWPLADSLWRADVLLPLAVLLGLVAAAALAYRRYPLATFCIAWLSGDMKL